MSKISRVGLLDRLEDPVRAHVFIAMLAAYLTWHRLSRAGNRGMNHMLQSLLSCRSD